MRNLLCASVVFALVGCCSGPMNTCGWNFSVGKAPLVYAPAVMSATAPMYGIAPVGAYPSAPPAGPVPPRMMSMPTVLPNPCEPVAAPARAAAPPTSPDCTCEELLRHLNSIETHIRLLEKAPMKLPKAD